MTPRLSKDVLENPLEYTKGRDIHDAGIVLLKMLLGKDVTNHYPDYHAALSTGSFYGFETECFIYLLIYLLPSHTIADNAPACVEHACTHSQACHCPFITC